MDHSWSREDKLKHTEIEQVLNDLVNSSDKQAEPGKEVGDLVSHLVLAVDCST